MALRASSERLFSSSDHFCLRAEVKRSGRGHKHGKQA